MGPRAGLSDVENRKFLTLLGLELRPFGRPALTQSLYRLCYPGSRSIRCRKCLNITYKIYRIQEHREMSELQRGAEGSQSRRRIKYGHESNGTFNQESLCWRGPATM
jgi:hypothetical protein